MRAIKPEFCTDAIHVRICSLCRRVAKLHLSRRNRRNHHDGNKINGCQTGSSTSVSSKRLSTGQYTRSIVVPTRRNSGRTTRARVSKVARFSCFVYGFVLLSLFTQCTVLLPSCFQREFRFVSLHVRTISQRFRNLIPHGIFNLLSCFDARSGALRGHPHEDPILQPKSTDRWDQVSSG